MFHIECESHLSGTRNEQFCYCGYDLCNKARSDGGTNKVIVIMVLVMMRIALVYL